MSFTTSFSPLVSSHPNHLQHLLPPATRSEYRQFLKDPVWFQRQPGHPDSLLSAINPHEHAHMRKLLSPAFTPRALRAQKPVLQKYMNLLVDRLREQVQHGDGVAGIDMGPWFNCTTFDVFGDLGFGESFDCLRHCQYHPWIALLFSNVKAASFVAAARYYPLVESLLMKCIPRSLQQKSERHYQQITTATVLTGILSFLVNEPGKMAQLVNEVRHAFSSSKDVTLQAVANLVHLNAVIQEGLRLCPPVPWMLPRLVPEEGSSVCGTWLPQESPVSLQAYSLNRDPSNFHEATTLLPERWLPDASTNADPPFFHDNRRAIQPFSIDPRSCLGQHLACAEMRLILAKLLLAFDFKAIDGKRLQWEDLRTFLLVEKRPLEVRVRLAG
ncbi:cytochrome P450 [Aspergillus heteromorphus CBS 117.55]|uniref:Cytochrome P450 n=1 Tax=Aspergillus heteromorphus CBS 117.55 TaxID=1448321 RepID=A0A317X069_9EURO|nr:cytochrome P450 [Aspergillus heteromorphus CBS 117.55]PWY90972.1 cytochrome P450 [Aspergillus heteromorphus CBS 117.55]